MEGLSWRGHGLCSQMDLGAQKNMPCFCEQWACSPEQDGDWLKVPQRVWAQQNSNLSLGFFETGP
jgi:hypothetical protein